LNNPVTIKEKIYLIEINIDATILVCNPSESL